MIPFFRQPLQWSEYSDLFQTILESGRFIYGVYNKEFEKAFALYCEAKACAAVNNGTSALRLMLKAAGIGPGDEVIIPDLTFAATIEAVLSVGAIPILADVMLTDLTLDYESVLKNITRNTKAILTVLLYGQWGNLEVLSEIAQVKGLLLLVDAAQAQGVRKEQKTPLYWCDAAAYSFYPSKNLGAFGEAGAVVSNNEELISKVRQLADHGQEEKNYSTRLGENARLSEIQAAVLWHKLPALDEANQHRRECAKLYTALINASPVFFDLREAYTVLGTLEPNFMAHYDHLKKVRFCPLLHDLETSVHHLYVVRVIGSSARLIKNRMAEKGIECAFHYPYALHHQSAFKINAHCATQLPVADQIPTHLLSLPLYPDLTRDEAEFIMASLIECGY